MNSQRLTALAIARALLEGAQTAERLGERLRACLAVPAPWCGQLVGRCAALPPERWALWTDRTLANWIERDVDFQAAWRQRPGPKPGRWILREAGGQGAPPAQLALCTVPALPHAGAVADWLRVSSGGLWRLTRGAQWQRRAPLVEQHYRYRLLQKRSGGWRLLEVPQPWLRALQRRVLDDLLGRLPPHEAAFAYVRGRSVVDHARAHVGQAVLLKFDLQDFFATVRAARVHALFATLGYSEEVARTLANLCTTATPESVLERLRGDGGLTWTQAQRLRDAHLPQGAPSSAALANLCAFGLDLRIDAYARGLGARYTRYADDLVLSGGEHLRGARARIEARLAAFAIEEGFALNHRKSRCVGAGRRQEVCHVVVNAATNLPRAEFDRLKATLHRCVVDGPWTQNRAGVPHWRAHLQGRIAWAAQLNPAKAERLRRLYERIDWRD